MVSPFRFVALAAVLLGTFVGVGFLHGLWTDRWTSPENDLQAREMEKISLTLGSWDGRTEDPEARDKVLPDEARISLRRRYVNHADGTLASIYLTRGRPGPMVIKHLPTECYPSSGFDVAIPPKRFLSQSKDLDVPDEFWVATFKKSSDVVPLTVRVYWSWTGNGQWQTPERPRLTFARYPSLLKMYVIQTIPDEKAEFEGAPVHDLIKELTREIRKSLFASAAR